MVFGAISMKQPTAIICLSPYSGGMELDAIKTAKHLSSIAPITVIAKKGAFIASKESDYVGYNGIKLETIAFKSSLSFTLIKQARAIIKQHNIKNVLFFGASELKSLYFAFLGLDINLLVRHGTTKSSPKKDFFHRLIYSNVSWHIANSKHILNNVKNIIPFGKNTQAKVIYPAFEFSTPSAIPHQKLTLLHVGRIAKGKGQKEAIEACEVLYKENIDFEFFIVGGFDDEDYKKEFLNFYEKTPYKEKIKLVGFTKDVTSYYNRSDIFVFPSAGEGLSNAFIEALSFGITAICYDNTSFPELQELGFEFKMVDNEDISSLANILKNLSQQELQYNTKNISLARKIFSLENERKKYKELLL